MTTTTNPNLHRYLACGVALFASCAGTGPIFDPHDPSTYEAAEFTQVKKERKPSPELLAPNERPYLLGVGDQIKLEISGHPESIASTFIMPDGMVYYDLAEGVLAEGKTIKQLQNELEAQLRKYYRSPIVSITLSEIKSKRIWVLGNVSTPGLYPLTQEMSLIDAISTGGGILTSRATGTTIQMADLSHSFIMRDGKMLPVDFEALVLHGDMSQNIMLQSDDYIYLPSVTNQEVFVLGAVRRPKSVGYKENLGIIGALAEVEGPLPGAFYQRMLVIRGSLQDPKVAIVNYDNIVKGKQRDIPLRPGDIVWVPRSPWERIERYIDAVIGVTTRTIAANEGRRAVLGDEAQTVDTTIGVGEP
ncbi:MAG: polysaccharide biosynthesis/export family protein [Verrucomicrobiota bacterium]